MVGSVLLNGIRVLIVDDSKDFRILLRTVLRNLGVEEVIEASCAREALEQLENTSVDLIISDHYMPASTGFELLSQIRRGISGIDRSTPFIILTGEARKLYIIAAARNGVDAYIIKPISPQTLEEKIVPIISGDRPLFDRWHAMNAKTSLDNDAILI